MADSWNPGVDEDKRTSDDPRKLGSKRISEDEEAALLAAGFTKSQLYNRRGGLVERGLASLLEPGDAIESIEPGRVLIRTKEGSHQTFWNLNQTQDFLRPITEEEKAAIEKVSRSMRQGSPTSSPKGSTDS